MLADSKAYSGFATDDLGAAHKFYEETLGVRVSVVDEGNLISLELAGGERPTLVYVKPDHVAATYTVLNFPVGDVDETVSELTARGVEFERYEGMGQDQQGISRDTGGPTIAWFKDPAGNILSIHEED